MPLELDLIEKEKSSIIIYEDNKSTKAIMQRQSSKNSKYYDIELLYLNYFVKGKEAKIRYIKSEENFAYTNIVVNKAFYHLRDLLKMVNVSKRKIVGKENSTVSSNIIDIPMWNIFHI